MQTNEEKMSNPRQQSMMLCYRTFFNPIISLTSAYALLGASVYETDQEIHKKYRDLIFKLHPDKYLHAPVNDKNNAAAQLQIINQAYEQIKHDRFMRIANQRRLTELSPVVDFIRAETKRFIRQQMARVLPQLPNDPKQFSKIYFTQLSTFKSRLYFSFNQKDKLAVEKIFAEFEDAWSDSQEQGTTFTIDQHPKMEIFLSLHHQANQTAHLIGWLEPLSHLSNQHLGGLLDAFNRAGIPLDQACARYADLPNDHSAAEFTKGIHQLMETEEKLSSWVLPIDEFRHKNITAIYEAKPYYREMSLGLADLYKTNFLVPRNRRKLLEVKEHAAKVGRGMQIMCVEVPRFNPQTRANLLLLRLENTLKRILTGSLSLETEELILIRERMISLDGEEYDFLNSEHLSYRDKVINLFSLLFAKPIPLLKKPCKAKDLEAFINCFKEIASLPVNVEALFLNQIFLDKLFEHAPYAHTICDALAEIMTWQSLSGEDLINPQTVEKVCQHACYLKLDKVSTDAMASSLRLFVELRLFSVKEEVLTPKNLEFCLNTRHLADILRKRIEAASYSQVFSVNEFFNTVSEILLKEHYQDLIDIEKFSALMDEINYADLTKNHPVSISQVVDVCWALAQKKCSLRDWLPMLLPKGPEACRQYVAQLNADTFSFAEFDCAISVANRL